MIHLKIAPHVFSDGYVFAFDDSVAIQILLERYLEKNLKESGKRVENKNSYFS